MLLTIFIIHQNKKLVMDRVDETIEEVGEVVNNTIGADVVLEPQRRITRKVVFAGLGILVLVLVVSFIMSFDESYFQQIGSQTTGAASASGLMVGLDSETGCGGTGDIIAVVRNVGEETLTVASLKFYLDGVEAAPTGCLGTIRPGFSATCTLSNPGKQGTIRLKVSGPANNVETPVFCG